MIDEKAYARECAQALVEHGIAVINQGDDMYHLSDLCPGWREATANDDALADRLWQAILDELEEVKITYQFSGETARDGELRRLQLARIRLQQQIQPLHTALSVLDRKIKNLDGE